MLEGKELLYNILNEKLESLSSIPTEDIIFDDINLVDLYRELEINPDVLSNVTDEIIKLLIKDKKIKEETIKLRDLFIGKRDYNLEIKMNPRFNKNIKDFKKKLKEYLDNIMPGLIDIEDLNNKLNKLLIQIDTANLINDIEFVEKLVKEYDSSAFDENMFNIMLFINNHNLTIIKNPKVNSLIFKVPFVKKSKIDDRIKEILNRLEVDIKDLPNYLALELKRCDVDKVTRTYDLVKKNKAEDYGILHLIRKENVLAKLVLILYSSETVIKYIVDSLRNEENQIDITSLKVLLNNNLTCFLERNNDYFKPQFNNYKLNLEFLRELNVNYRALINRTPLFFSLENDILKYILSYTHSMGADKKKIINRCYKTLAINPSLIIENVDLLLNYNIDIKSYFNNNKNYSIIKIPNLEQKIDYLANENLISKNNLDLDELNKIIVEKLIKESSSINISWGE